MAAFVADIYEIELNITYNAQNDVGDHSDTLSRAVLCSTLLYHSIRRATVGNMLGS